MINQLPKLLPGPLLWDIPELCVQGLVHREWTRKQVVPIDQPDISLWNHVKLNLEKDAEMLTCPHSPET